MSNYQGTASPPPLSLYRDKATSDTGQYFCDQRPFALPRAGNKVSILKSGQEALAKIHKAMLAARSFIWIADWQMACDVELADRDHPDRPGRLHNVIQWIISTKPVHIRILLYGSPVDSAVGTYDGLVTDRIMDLNKKGYPGTVEVLQQTSTSGQFDAIDYSHHQKFVVVDGELAYIGGIDLSYGRWESPNFDVVVDPEHFVINEMYNPCLKKVRCITTNEKAKIAKYGFERPYGGTLMDEGCQPRMPWQDVHIEINGPSVVDIHRNFVRRWNSCAARLDTRARTLLKHGLIDRKWLEKIGAWDRLRTTQAKVDGGALVQIVRSVSAGHLKPESKSLDDLQLYSAKERAMWDRCISAWRETDQSNILSAMLNCIRSADNYIYIETQFFISQFGTRSGFGGTTHGNEDNGIKNTIVEALAKRIEHHIFAKGSPPFHVYLVIPVNPEGDLSKDQTWKQHWLAQASIKHGTQSLIQRIKESLKRNSRKPDEWPQYLTVLNMRSYGATVMYARNPETFDEEYDHEIGRYVITEQVYIHSKLLIVDDAVAIVGSANTNDRSLTGNGDTEIAAVVVDTEGVELRDLGSPDFKVRTRKFARELRIQLWEKHFGFHVGAGDSKTGGYFRATDRAKRAREKIPAAIPHPPRERTTEARIQATAKVPWSKIRDQPCAPETVRAIQRIAARNADAYERVFRHTARNSIPTFDRTVEMSLDTPPYAATYNYLGVTDFGFIKSSRYPEKFRGVLPPPLQEAFMTSQMLPHQQSSMDKSQYTHRQQTYENSKIHDVAKAIEYLMNNVCGFFVLAPLDWGKHQIISGDPTKGTAAKVDLATHTLPEDEGEKA
jgi:phospholipase D1/2